MVRPLALVAALLFTMLNPVVSQGAGAGDLAVCNNIPQQPYEFARIFSAFNG